MSLWSPNDSNSWLIDENFENAQTGEQLRIRVYSYPSTPNERGGVVLAAFRETLGDHAAPEVAEQQKYWFGSDEKPDIENFFGLNENTLRIRINNELCHRPV